MIYLLSVLAFVGFFVCLAVLFYLFFILPQTSIIPSFKSSINQVLREVTEHSIIHFTTMAITTVMVLGIISTGTMQHLSGGSNDGLPTASEIQQEYRGSGDASMAVEAGSADEGAILVFIVTITGVYLSPLMFIFGFIRFREGQRSASTPTSSIHSAPMGPVELKGEAESPPGEDLVHAPFINRECLAYDVRLQGLSTEYDTWVDFIDHQDAAELLVTDETGKALVQPNDQTRYRFETERKHQLQDEQEQPREVREYLKNHPDRAPASLRVIAGFIDPGDEVYVYGEGQPDQRYDLSIGTGSTAEKMVLSNQSERELVQEAGRHSFIFILGGALSTIFFYIMLVGLVGLL